MSGEKPHVSSLESRKQLLVAESEINRAQMLQEMETLAGGARSFAHRARSFGSIASAAASLASGLGAIRCHGSDPTVAKPFGWETLLRGARLACSIGLALRDRSRS